MNCLSPVRVGLALSAAVLVGHGIVAAKAESKGTEKGTSGYLDAAGSKIYYETRGSGPAIVLLHDGLLASPTWDEVWEPFGNGHQLIRYDRRGYGRSDEPVKSYSSTEDLLKLLAHLKVEHAVIVGSSSGGALAIDFAIAHPEIVDGLFLIGPVLHGMEYSAEFRERANKNNEPMERGDVKAWARNWSQDRFMIAGANEAARRKVYEQLVANAEKLKNFDSALEEKLSPPASQRLSAIKAPTLILVGEGDIADVQAHCDAIKAGVHDSERLVVKGAGHLIQIEKPGEVTPRLENFAERCARNIAGQMGKPKREGTRW
jgi:pimeloyl-ACP methyl ester carboxylesterase